MLILDRRRGEKVIIQSSDGIITILPMMIDGESVSIGVDAPAHVAVDRFEVYMRKQGEIHDSKRNPANSFLRRAARALKGGR